MMADVGSDDVRSGPNRVSDLADFVSEVGQAPAIAATVTTKPSGDSEVPRHLVLVSPSGRHQEFEIPDGLSQAAALLQGKELIVHDGYQFTTHVSPFLDLASHRLADTMLAARIIDGGQSCDNRDAFELSACCHRGGIQSPPPLGGGRFGVRPADAARRAHHLYELWLAQKRALAGAGLERVAALEFALIPFVGEMALAGIMIDEVKWGLHVDRELVAMASLRESIGRELGPINVDDDRQLLRELWKRGVQVPSSKKADLLDFAALPIVGDILEYREARDFVRNTGIPIRKRLAESKDGRVRARISQLGAATGRMSASAPPLMAFPKRGGARRAVVGAPGMKLIIADYVAIEMRVLAQQIQEPTLLELFVKGCDPHVFLGATLFKASAASITDAQRKGAKAINYGFLYGMWIHTFIAYARKIFRLRFSESEARSFRDGFFRTYPAIREWHERMAGDFKPSMTPLGRIRYFLDDDSVCVRLNSPVQSTAADGLKLAILLLAPRIRALGARIILSIHDELIVEAPAEVAEEVKTIVVECMKDGMSKFVPGVPIEVKAAIRHCWGE